MLKFGFFWMLHLETLHAFSFTHVVHVFISCISCIMHFTHGSAVAFCSSMADDKQPVVQVGCVCLKIEVLLFFFRKELGEQKRKDLKQAGHFFWILPEFKFLCPCQTGARPKKRSRPNEAQQDAPESESSSLAAQSCKWPGPVVAASRKQQSKQGAERSQMKNLKPEGKQAATTEINTSPPVHLLVPVVRPGC